MNVEPNDNDLEIGNLPNYLTILRILLIPVVIALLWFSDSQAPWIQAHKSNLGWAAGWIFTIASITDFFDGYIARKRNIVTVFGSFLDPIADKFLTVSSLIMLQSLGRLPAVIVIFLVLREMYMTSLRLLAMNEGVKVPVSDMGKWKTAMMMFGIPFIMANETWSLIPSIPLPLIGAISIYIAAILSLWSAITYTFHMIQKLKISRAKLRKQRKEKRQHINEGEVHG
jgi:CDP-diacylglycerol--glycerol-3-phosphate 3-phosphatidyltransferase